MLASVHSMVVNLIGNGQSYLNMLTKAESGTKTFTSTVQKSFIALDQFNQLMKGINRDVSQALGGSSIIGAFGEFDHAFTQSTAIMKTTEKQMEGMRAQAMTLSKSLPIAPARFAEAYFFLASAGYKAEEAIKALPIIATFATAGVMDLAKATSLAADAQSALGLRTGVLAQDMKNLQRVTDVLVEANVLANANVEQFSTSLTRGAGSSLKIFNKSVEEGVAVLAAMADQGIKAEIAGTSLQRVLLLLSRAAVNNQEALKKYGIEVFDSSGSMKNVADIIGDMEKAFADLSDQTRTSALEQIGFQARVQGAILPLIGTSKKIREYQAALEAAGGATQRIAEKQLASFVNQMTLVRNKLTIVAIEIGGIVAPAIAKMTSYVAKAADWWIALNNETKRIIVTLGSMSIGFLAFIPIVKIIGALFSFLPGPMSILVGSVSKLSGLFLMLISPIRLVVDSVKFIGASLLSVLMITKLWFSPTFVILRTVLSIGAALYVWIQRMGGLEDAWRQIEYWAASVWEWILPIKNALGSMFDVVVEKGIRLLVRSFEKAGEVMLSTLSWLSSYIQIPWEKVQYVIVAAIKYIEMFARNSLAIWNYFSSIVVSLLSPIITQMANMGMVAWETMKNFAISNVKTILTVISLVVSIKALIGVYSTLYGAISSFLAIINLGRISALAYATVLGIINSALITYRFITLSATIVSKGLLIVTSVLISFTAILGTAIRVLGAANLFLAQTFAVVRTSAFLFALTAKIVAAVTTLTVFGANLLKASLMGLQVAIALTQTAIQALQMSLIFLQGTTILLAALLTNLANLLAFAPLIIGIGAIYVLIRGLGTLGGYIFGAIGGVKSLIQTIVAIPVTFGPVKTITSLFGQWGGIISEVARALMIDMDLAWEMTKKAGELAVAQFEDLWPPLWEFISKGFKILSGAMIDTFKYTFLQIEQEALFLGMKLATLGLGSKNAAIKHRESMQQIAAQIDALQSGAQFKMEQLAKGFDKKFKVGNKAKQIEKELSGLSDNIDLANAIKLIDDEYDKAMQSSIEKTIDTQQKAAEEAYKKVGQSAGSGVSAGIKDALKDINAVLFGSAEAARRIDEYNAILNEQNKGVKRKPEKTYDFNKAGDWANTFGKGAMNAIDLYNRQQQFFTPQGFADTANLIFAGFQMGIEQELQRRQLSHKQARMNIFEARERQHAKDVEAWFESSRIVDQFSAAGGSEWKDIFGSDDSDPSPIPPVLEAKANTKDDTDLLKEIRDALVSMEKNSRIGDNGILFPANLG